MRASDDDISSLAVSQSAVNLRPGDCATHWAAYGSFRAVKTGRQMAARQKYDASLIDVAHFTFGGDCLRLHLCRGLSPIFRNLPGFSFTIDQFQKLELMSQFEGVTQPRKGAAKSLLHVAEQPPRSVPARLVG
jgi:hypothetical protein